LLIQIYYQTHVTHEFIGYFVGLDETNICLLFSRLQPILAKHLHIEKDRTLTDKAIEKLLMDVTEQPIQRPRDKNNRKRYYSSNEEAPYT